MELIYRIVVAMYGALISFASIFNNKARLWVKGRKKWKSKLAEALGGTSKKRIWFHCSSLGEFEQGRPVLQQIRNEFPDHFIVLSFFSPSGYEVKKNEKIADYVCYLPLDGPSNSKMFVQLLNPSLVFFVKYDFWYFYGKQLHARKIPFFCISAIFRPGQVFFKSWGKFFKKMLTRYTHLFVQDQASLELLYRNSIPSVTVSGDTRFDRVLENSTREAAFPAIRDFCAKGVAVVAGSTWPQDEKVLAGVLAKNPTMKLVIAPHELGESRIKNIEARFAGKTIRYSTISADIPANVNVVIIDSIGMLSLLYRFGKYSYVGGGFGKGIHNILEAAVYGQPVFFGPNFKKFKEARDLKATGAAMNIKNAEELNNSINSLELDASSYEQLTLKNKKYIESRKGATEILMNYLRLNHVVRMMENVFIFSILDF